MSFFGKVGGRPLGRKGLLIINIPVIFLDHATEGTSSHGSAARALVVATATVLRRPSIGWVLEIKAHLQDLARRPIGRSCLATVVACLATVVASDGAVGMRKQRPRAGHPSAAVRHPFAAIQALYL